MNNASAPPSQAQPSSEVPWVGPPSSTPSILCSRVPSARSPHQAPPPLTPPPPAPSPSFALEVPLDCPLSHHPLPGGALLTPPCLARMEVSCARARHLPFRHCLGLQRQEPLDLPDMVPCVPVMQTQPGLRGDTGGPPERGLLAHKRPEHGGLQGRLPHLLPPCTGRETEAQRGSQQGGCRPLGPGPAAASVPGQPAAPACGREHRLAPMPAALIGTAGTGVGGQIIRWQQLAPHCP